MRNTRPSAGEHIKNPAARVCGVAGMCLVMTGDAALRVEVKVVAAEHGN
jgi:hypothetical protein